MKPKLTLAPIRAAAGGALAAAIALAGALCGGVVHAQAEGAPHRVVVLNASDPYLPAFLALDQAMRGEIRARLKQRVEFHAETLDMLRFPGAQFEQEAAALLIRKYRDLRIDAVVAVETTALDFAERHGKRLWPGAAVVFHSVPAAALEGRKLAARTGGVPVRLDIAGTLELALRLRPDARRVFLVGGTAEFDRNLLAVARAELGRLAGRLRVDEIVESSIERSLAAVGRLPADSLVLYLSVFRDGAGMPQVPREVLRQVAAAANAPVFGIFETYLGEGIVAGSIASYEAQGRRAGELVARVLEGERASELGVLAPVPVGCVADWRLLQRWGLDERRLPEGCEVRFREPSAWQLYRWHILGALVVILLQGALIAALVVQRKRRHRAELAAQHHRMELAHAGRLATAGELTAAIAHEVNQPLGAILANVDAAEMLLDSGKARPEELRQILADLRRDDLRASEVIGRLRALLARQEMARERLDLNVAVTGVLSLLEAEARRRHAALAVELDDTLPQVLGDRVHLQQVLLNLIINAMDAMADTAAGERRVLVRTARDGHGGVEVSVADRGPGIAPDRLPRLFESFYTTKKQGMGLGLSIARSIVEAHGGRIWAESGERGGATFRFTLPPAPAAKLPLRGG